MKVRIVEFDRSTDMEETSEDYEVANIRHKVPSGDLIRVGREDLTILKLSKTIDLSFNSHLSAACYPTCDDMFDVEFKVLTLNLLC